MPQNSDGLAGRWRRLDRAVAAAKSAENDFTSGDMQDAVANALTEIYELWEAWRVAARLPWAQQNAYVTGDAAGETTAALVFARRGKTHSVVEFGESCGFGEGPFGRGPFGGGWHWQPHVDPNPQYLDRNAWYATHVEYRPVVPVLRSACDWLRARPELTPSPTT